LGAGHRIFTNISRIKGKDKTMETKRVAIYARVSSEKQAEKDLSIPAQLKALRKYAIGRGWEIVVEYVDEAESARSASRPAFQEMIAATKKKERPFDVIMVWKLSRFARNREDSIIYKSLLRKRGISVVSINEQIDDTAAGKLLEGMIEVIDEFYSANLAQDTMRGMKENVNRGFFNGGLVPFGYRKVKVPVGNTQKTKLEPDEMEAVIVKRAFQLALDGKGSKEIAKTLNAEGLRTRAGRLFGTTIINYWLRNPVYTGVMAWNRTDRTHEKVLHKPPSEIIYTAEAHQPIISLGDFERVQELLTERRPAIRHPRVVSSQYLLSGLSYCGKCGAAMVGCKAKSGRYSYYECDTRYKKGIDGCIGLRIGKDRLERFVVDRIKQNILTEESLVDLIRLANEELIESTSRHKRQLNQLEKRLHQASSKLTRLYVALESGKLDLDDLAPRIKELREHQHELQKQRDELIGKIESKTPKTLDSDAIVAYAKELAYILSESSFLQRKTFLRTFIQKIEVNPENVIVDYTLPIPMNKDRTSTKEVLYINRIGSGGWI
jgi:DNA invertase Pin-like site-specific DNA recombinase